MKAHRFQRRIPKAGITATGSFPATGNAARRLMQSKAFGKTSSRRGYADQKLRKPDDP